LIFHLFLYKYLNIINYDNNISNKINQEIMGIGDWGLGIGDWGLGIGPNPQSPIPNPHYIIIINLFYNF